MLQHGNKVLLGVEVSRKERKEILAREGAKAAKRK
jgi:hypothetical protein